MSNSTSSSTLTSIVHDDSTGFLSTSTRSSKGGHQTTTNATSTSSLTSSSNLTSTSSLTYSSSQRRHHHRGGSAGGGGGLSQHIAPENSSKRKVSAARDRLGIGVLKFDNLGVVYGRQNEKTLIKDAIKRIINNNNNNNKDDNNSRSGRCELILISGVSGCGKTTLARNVVKSYTTMTTKKALTSTNKIMGGGIFVEGKFDNNLSSSNNNNNNNSIKEGGGEPYTGIKKACMQLCGELLHYLKKKTTTKAESSNFLKEMIHELGSEIGLLIDLIPELEEVLEMRQQQQQQQQDSNGNGNSSNNNNNFLSSSSSPADDDHGTTTGIIMVTEGSKSRLHNAFRRLIRLISTKFVPLVIFFDDMQRADQASLELIHAIVSDTDNVNGRLVIVGTYRSDEVDADGHQSQQQQQQHILSDYILSLKDVAASKKDEGPGMSVQVTEIKLENFTPDEVKKILMIVLSMDDDCEGEITRLATLCHKRTLGNIFHLNYFLRDLVNENLLQFNLSFCRWTWDEVAILSSTAASKNVVDLMRQRLLQLPISMQRRLSLVACLGASFDVKTEEIVWRRIISGGNNIDGDDDDDGDDDTTTTTGTNWLEVAIDNGILEEIGDGGRIEYRWAHDQIQASALELVPPEELPGFKTMIGQALLNHLPKDEANDTYIFAISDLLNSGTTTISDDDDVRKLELAQVNLRATVKASELVALNSSLHYATSGIQNLPVADDDAWGKHYELTLELYSHAAVASNILGLKEELYMYAGMILKQKNRPLMDKLRAHKALINNKTRDAEDESLRESLEMLLDVLAQLGCKFPKRKSMQLLTTMKALLKIKKKLKSLTEKEVVENTRKVDPFQLQIMEFLATSMDLVFNTKPGLLGPWILTFGQIALDNGVCKYSQSAYAQLGIVFLTMNDIDAAEKCGLISEKLMKTFDFKDLNAHAAFQIYGFSVAFRRPYHKIHQALMDGYRDGLNVGDNNSSTTCIVLYNYMSLSAGFPLRTMEADLCRYTAQLKEMNNIQGATNMTALWQCVLNLMGKSDSPCVLQGNVIPDLEAFQESITIESMKVLVIYLQSFLLAIFGDYEKGAALALANDGRFQKASSGIFMNMHETFVRGLNLFGMAKRSKNSKFKRAARRVLSIISGWVKKDNPNVLHYEKLFKAELCSLNGKLDSAELLYHQALSLASRSGLIHDAAIINERCAEFFLEKRKSVDDAKYKMIESIKLYEEWGCHIKADMLRAQHDVISPPSNVFAFSQN